MATSQDFVNWVCGPELDPDYLKYVLIAERDSLLSFASGTTHQTIYYPEAKAFHALLPPVKQQGAIVRLLRALDDKIEVNRRVNETLEAMARALFRSWFVDFDHVRAKMEGRAPVGMDAETAALFPDGFEDSELGEIPRGWTIERLGDHVTVTKGKSYRSDDLQASDVALVTLKSFRRGGGYRDDGLKPYVGEYKPQQVVNPGELVVAFTDVTQAADVIGKPALVRRPSQFTTLVASLDVGIVRPNTSETSLHWLYLGFMEPTFQEHTYAHSNGSTVLHLAKDAIATFAAPWPSAAVMRAFGRMAAPLFERIDGNLREAETLASLRDLLLPKVLSGELRVKDAEKQLEAVA